MLRSTWPLTFLKKRSDGGGGVSLGLWKGAKVYSYASASDQVVSLTNLLDENGNSVTLLDGDYIVVTLNRGTQTAGNLAQSVLLASDGTTDYTAAHTDLYADDNNNCNFQVSYKKMGATPDTTVTLKASTTGQGVAAHIMVLRGVHATTPLDVTPTTATGIDTGVPDPPSITPSTAGSLITVHGSGASSVALTNPGDLSTATNTFLFTGNAASAPSGTAVGIKTDWTSGAFDPNAFTGGNTSTSLSWCAATIAWRPA